MHTTNKLFKLHWVTVKLQIRNALQECVIRFTVVHWSIFSPPISDHPSIISESPYYYYFNFFFFDLYLEMCVSSSCIICDDDITFNFNMSVRENLISIMLIFVIIFISFSRFLEHIHLVHIVVSWCFMSPFLLLISYFYVLLYISLYFSTFVICSSYAVSCAVYKEKLIRSLKEGELQRVDKINKNELFWIF